MEFYYRGADAGTDGPVPIQTLSDLQGDCIMNAPILDFASDLVTFPHSGGRYVYVLDHDFAFNQDGLLPGSHHGDDIFLEFDIQTDGLNEELLKAFNKTSLVDWEKGLAAKFVEMITTFAKTG